MSDLLQALQPIAAIATALFAGLIAYQQKEIAAEKLKLEKFDRRFRVFDATRRFLAHILRTGNVDPNAERDFWDAIGDACFLFDADIVTYLEDLRVRAIEFPAIDRQQIKWPEKRREAFEHFEKDIKTLHERFGRFLALNQR